MELNKSVSLIQTRNDLTKLINERGYKTAAEIGVRIGNFSAHLLQNSNLDILYSIDCWENNSENHDGQGTYLECERKLAKFERRSQMIKKYSNQAVLDFPDNSLDVVYIDSLHSYEAISEDLRIWWPKVKYCMGFHDYSEKHWPGIFRAVNEFVTEKGLKLCLTDPKLEKELAEDQISGFVFKE